MVSSAFRKGGQPGLRHIIMRVGPPHGSRGRLEGTVDWLLFPQAFDETYFRESRCTSGTTPAVLLLAECLPPSLPGVVFSYCPWGKQGLRVCSWVKPRSTDSGHLLPPTGRAPRQPRAPSLGVHAPVWGVTTSMWGKGMMPEGDFPRWTLSQIPATPPTHGGRIPTVGFPEGLGVTREFQFRGEQCSLRIHLRVPPKNKKKIF